MIVISKNSKHWSADGKLALCGSPKKEFTFSVTTPQTGEFEICMRCAKQPRALLWEGWATMGTSESLRALRAALIHEGERVLRNDTGTDMPLRILYALLAGPATGEIVVQIQTLLSNAIEQALKLAEIYKQRAREEDKKAAAIVKMVDELRDLFITRRVTRMNPT